MGERLVILAGGISSRMKRAAASTTLDAQHQYEADHLPKSMISIGNSKRPFLDYLLYNARSAGYTDIVIVIGRNDDSIHAYYGPLEKKNSFHGLSISYAVQSIPEGRTKPLGTADALLQGLLSVPEWSGKYFTVCNSDNLYSVAALSALLNVSENSSMSDYDSEALGIASNRVNQFAVTKKDAEGNLLSIIEKPSESEMKECRNDAGKLGVSMNMFRLPYDKAVSVLREVPLHPVRLEKELPAAVIMMIERYHEKVRAVECAEPVPDLTSKDDIGPVSEMLLRSFPEDLWNV
jgi:NDP-sugar pyrophosphorylase family protein